MLRDMTVELSASSAEQKTRPSISMIGTRAMLFEAPGDFTLAQQRRIWAITEASRARHDVAEVVVGVTNLMLVFTQAPDNPTAIIPWLLNAWDTLPEHHIEGRLFEIGVRYGGELGEDLSLVAHHAGISCDEVISLHRSAEYTVCALGSVPGFGYLHGLNTRIATPRKAVPSLNMQAGAILSTSN